MVATISKHNPHMRFLSVRFCEEFSNRVCTHLQQLQRLEWLRLKKLIRVAPQAMVDLFSSNAMKCLTRLDLTECAQLNDDGVSVHTCVCVCLCVSRHCLRGREDTCALHVQN